MALASRELGRPWNNARSGERRAGLDSSGHNGEWIAGVIALEVLGRKVFLSEPSKEADCRLDVSIGVDEQLAWIEKPDEKAAQGFWIETPAPRCRLLRIITDLGYSGDCDERNSARLENARHGSESGVDIEN